MKTYRIKIAYSGRLYFTREINGQKFNVYLLRWVMSNDIGLSAIYSGANKAKLEL